jgi:hypothetical protein
MGGITMAWLAGLGIISWRSFQKDHHAPIPGTLLAASALFALLALAAEYQPARGAATAAAFGLDLAAWLKAPLITPKQAAGLNEPTPTGGKNPAGTSGNPIGEAAASA